MIISIFKRKFVKLYEDHNQPFHMKPFILKDFSIDCFHFAHECYYKHFLDCKIEIDGGISLFSKGILLLEFDVKIIHILPN